MRKQRLFVDMDGTLCKWQRVQHLEDLYAPGFFAKMQPQMSVVEAVRTLVRTGDMDVYILSAVLSDSPYARREKLGWLQQYLPELAPNHVLFPPCGTCKADFVPGGVQAEDVLLDDYTKNLLEWPGVGIKVLNGINHTHRSWQGSCVRAAEEGYAVWLEILYGSGVLDRPEEEQVPVIKAPEISM